MSKEIWKDQEAYDVVFNHLNNCTCQDGKLLTRSALDHIYKALKRNEPAKVIFTRVTSYKTGYSWDETTCPKCKSPVGDAEKFCSECGQKLDWSE